MASEDEDRQPPGLRSRIAGGIERGQEAARQGLQRSGELATEAAERRGMSEQLDSARQGLRRSGEVLTGADVRRFDEFTDAVTRVALGLHRDQTEMRELLARLEEAVNEIRGGNRTWQRWREHGQPVRKRFQAFEQAVTSNSPSPPSPTAILLRNRRRAALEQYRHRNEAGLGTRRHSRRTPTDSYLGLDRAQTRIG